MTRRWSFHSILLTIAHKMTTYTDYQIFALDSNLDRIGLIEQWDRLEIALRFNDLGSFAFESPISLLDTGWLEFGGGVEIMRNGSFLMQGIFLGFDEDDGEKKQVITCWGADKMFWLSARLAYPVVTGPPFTSSAYDSRTGYAGDVMIDFVDYNAGANASGARPVSGLGVATKLGVGTSLTQRARFENLLELCQEIALKGGDIGFYFDSGFDFTPYAPTDKTASIIFSKELGNLTRYQRKIKMPQSNYIVAGGGGEGTSRTFVTVNDSASITNYGRIEWFYDYRNAADTTQLTDAANGKLETFAEQIAIEIWPIEITNMMYGANYNLGDKVTVVLPSQTIQDKIREVKLMVTPTTQEVVTPVIGTPGSRSEQGGAANIYARTKALATRLNLLERR